MPKPHPKPILLTAALALLAGALALFLILRSPPGTFSGTIPEGVSKQQAAAVTLSKTDLQLAKQASDKDQDAATREALLKEYKKAQILRHGGAHGGAQSETTFFDLTTGSKQRIVISITDNGKTVHKYLWEESLLLVNEDNKAMRIIGNDFQLNVTNDDLPRLDPFKDNPACLEVYEKKETSKEKLTGLFESAGYTGEQTMRAYETQNRFETTQSKGTVFPVGTSLPVIALTQKISVQTLIDMVNKCEISIGSQSALSADTLFVTFKRQNFHHERNVTVTNPMAPYNGKETYIYSVSDSGIVEVNYRTPQFVNTAKDIVASNIMSKPYSMKECDAWHMSKARSSLSGLINEEPSEFILWSEYDVGGVE